MILAAAASDAGAYYVQAVNERNGENKTSPPVHLSIASECPARTATGAGDAGRGDAATHGRGCAARLASLAGGYGSGLIHCL